MESQPQNPDRFRSNHEKLSIDKLIISRRSNYNLHNSVI